MRTYPGWQSSASILLDEGDLWSKILEVPGFYCACLVRYRTYNAPYELLTGSQVGLLIKPCRPWGGGASL